ncbi:asparaginase [Kaistia dalseonensis]|uniref:L-asparaginase n=1 Tax=Kaistia dalseonensis TaxID=410840 RepID=A0ABU0H3R6_9HYPH|nr:asparaginase [Kaistia dalseonensis]MCX5494361.1 asparaginase [Kaistia dalseonensis]MDQ0436943.1 L-asparaginase [Kaistia dalseonensis]
MAGANVVVLTTGGTIASNHDVQSGSVQVRLDAGALLASVAADGLPAIEARGIFFKSSFALTLDDGLAIVRAIKAELARDEVAGVVVTHGTDTMEETAFLADLLIAPGKPVVFTGAQLAADHPGADGPRNIADAIRVAAAPAAIGLGALIVFDGDILAARDATKRHTSQLHAFAAPGRGPLGIVMRGAVHITHRPASYERFGVEALAEPVDLITLAMGGGDRLLRAAVETGARGIVLNATGLGNAAPPITAYVGELVACGLPVVVTSRCGEGRVAPVYGAGGGVDLEKAGAIFAGDLNGPKARLLLALALAQPEPRNIAELIASVVDAEP